MTANYWNCFVCGEKLWSKPFWTRGRKVCCQKHIRQIYDTHDEEWVNASYDFDYAEEFQLET